MRFLLRKTEFSLTVGRPYPQCTSGKRRKHHRIVFLDLDRSEHTFKFTGFVVEHFWFLIVLWVQKSQLNEKLTSIADTQRKRILFCKECLNGFVCLFVIQKCAGPAFGTPQNITVAETAH